MIAARLRRPSLPSSAMASAFSVLHGAASNTSANGPSSSQFTVTALGRWSILNKQLPALDKIKALHVYDFDNTLFKTPLPNPSLWQGQTLGSLASQDVFANGGWWHDNRFLTATGEGADKEEQRAWDGWWNEKIVELIRLSMKQPDALTVLLTGRSEKNFSELIQRIVKSKDIDFDMIGLKPQVSPTNQRFQSTMHFKQLFLNAMMETYTGAEEIRIYEDRVKHTKGFRDFLAEYNRRQTVSPTRGPITAEVVQVADISTSLDPVVEVAEVQHMLNSHNEMATKDRSRKRLMIKKTVYFTGYMINSDDSQKLINLAQIQPGLKDQDLIYHGNNILICPRPCPDSILEKVGGMGSKMNWEVTGIGCYQNRIWAARLRPVPETAKFHTDNPIPLAVLALRKGCRPFDASKIENWEPIPPEESFVLETTVGEKVILRIEPEDPKEGEYESQFANKASKRKHAGEDSATRNQYGPYGGRNETRKYHTGGRGGGRGRGNQNRGNRGGRGGRRGRGYHNYRSLDDVENKNQRSGYNATVDYDDVYPSLGQVHGQQRQPSGNHGPYRAAQNQGGSQGRPMAAQASNGQDLQNYY